MAENFRLDRPIGFVRGGQVFITPEFQRQLMSIDRLVVETQRVTTGTPTLAAYPQFSVTYSAPDRDPVFASYGASSSTPFFARYPT